MSEDLMRSFQRINEGYKTFGDSMREKGIHVGLGSTPVCVTCGEAWPCEASKVAPD